MRNFKDLKSDIDSTPNRKLNEYFINKILQEVQNENLQYLLLTYIYMKKGMYEKAANYFELIKKHINKERSILENVKILFSCDDFDDFCEGFCCVSTIEGIGTCSCIEGCCSWIGGLCFLYYIVECCCGKGDDILYCSCESIIKFTECCFGCC